MVQKASGVGGFLLLICAHVDAAQQAFRTAFVGTRVWSPDREKAVKSHRPQEHLPILQGLAVRRLSRGTT